MSGGRRRVTDKGQSRAAGALYGLAIGDALGMPGESLSREQIVARYGPLVGTFQPGPPDHPLAAGLPAGTVTDDTEQALLLAGLLIDRGRPRGPGRAGHAAARVGGVDE